MTEQERADRFADALDGLLSGEQSADANPLLQMAVQLAALPLEPGPQARAQFEAQLERWFGLPPSPATPRTLPVWLGGIALILAILLLAGLARTVFAPPDATASLTSAPSIPTTTSSPTLTATPSLTTTGTHTPQPTPTQTASVVPTRVPFTKIVIGGLINAIQGETILVAGISIRLTGGMAGLCVGDTIQVIVTIADDGTYTANHTALSVRNRACGRTPLPPHSAPSREDDEEDDDD